LTNPNSYIAKSNLLRIYFINDKIFFNPTRFDILATVFQPKNDLEVYAHVKTKGPVVSLVHPILNIDPLSHFQNNALVTHSPLKEQRAFIMVNRGEKRKSYAVYNDIQEQVDIVYKTKPHSESITLHSTNISNYTQLHRAIDGNADSHVQNRPELCEKNKYYIENLYKITMFEPDKFYLKVKMYEMRHIYESESSIDAIINDCKYLMDHDIDLDKHCPTFQDLLNHTSEKAQISRFRNEYTVDDSFINCRTSELYPHNRNNVLEPKPTDL
jgi:hypothetical protein